MARVYAASNDLNPLYVGRSVKNTLNLSTPNFGVFGAGPGWIIYELTAMYSQVAVRFRKCDDASIDHVPASITVRGSIDACRWIPCGVITTQRQEDQWFSLGLPATMGDFKFIELSWLSARIPTYSALLTDVMFTPAKGKIALVEHYNLLLEELKLTKQRLEGCFTLGLSGMQFPGHGGGCISGWINVGPIVMASANAIQGLEETHCIILKQLVIMVTGNYNLRDKLSEVAALVSEEFSITKNRLEGCFTLGLSGMQYSGHAARCIEGWNNVGPVLILLQLP